MKPLFFRLTLVAGIAIIALASFTTLGKPYRQLLKVERQQWTLQHMRGNIPSEEFDIGVAIDVPVSGPALLVDSVMRLLNQAMYDFLEYRETPHYTFGEVYCSDGKELLQQYREAYKPFLEDTCEFHCCFPDFDFLCVSLVEQTESFVTYEVSSYFIGEGDCEYLNWITFDKSDGHRLSKVINDDDVLQFLKDTDGTDYNVWYDVEYRLAMGYEAAWRCTFGLTADSLRCQYFYAPGIVETFSLDLEPIKPYLTKEAGNLLE